MPEPFRPIELRSVPKTYRLDQDKAADPMATVDRAREQLFALVGKENLKVDVSPFEIPGAYHFTVATESLSTSGKGLSPAQALASGVMEFVERFAWLGYDYERTPGYQQASYDTVRAGAVRTVEPDYFLYNFHDLADRDLHLAELRGVDQKWVLGTALDDGGPFAYPLNWHNMLFSSNGLASGNSLEEAVVQALCELIERDHVYRLFVLREPAREVPLESIEAPLLRGVLESAQASGSELTVLDLSYDLGVPTFLVRGRRPNEPKGLVYDGVGQGCHTDPVKALARAVSEYVEGLSAVRRLETRLLTHLDGDLRILGALLPKQHLGFHARLAPEMLDARAGVRAFGDIESVAADDFKVEIERLARRLVAHGHVPVVIDKSHPAIDLPVVRAFVPTMRSCINTDIDSPAGVLAAVLHEAGHKEASERAQGDLLGQHPLFAALRDHPLVGATVRKITAGVAVDPELGADYRASLRSHNAFRRNGLVMLEQLEELGPLLGPALRMLQAS